jgi:predicted ABC-type ATPase
MSSHRPSNIYVIAGVNGAGKSSIAGAAIRGTGGYYYNPDDAASKLLEITPTLTQAEANSAAWHEGVRLLKRAIDERLDFAFETTLGANTIPRLLMQAALHGIQIHVWYVGLAGPELHIGRVRARVLQGGHDIAEADIRRRYERSQLNLIELLPRLTTLRVFDNSHEADPATGHTPKPVLVLHVERGKILAPADFTHTPEWAKAIVVAAARKK